jgi:hypothetical protein
MVKTLDRKTLDSIYEKILDSIITSDDLNAITKTVNFIYTKSSKSYPDFVDDFDKAISTYSYVSESEKQQVMLRIKNMLNDELPTILSNISSPVIISQIADFIQLNLKYNTTPIRNLLFDKDYQKYKMNEYVYKTTSKRNLENLGIGDNISSSEFELDEALSETEDIPPCKCEPKSGDVRNYYDYREKRMIRDTPSCIANVTVDPETQIPTCKVHGEFKHPEHKENKRVLRIPGPQFYLVSQNEDYTRRYLSEGKMTIQSQSISEEEKKKRNTELLQKIQNTINILDIEERQEFSVIPQDIRNSILFEKYILDLYYNIATNASKFLNLSEYMRKVSNVNTPMTSSKMYNVSLVSDPTVQMISLSGGKPLMIDDIKYYVSKGVIIDQEIKLPEETLKEESEESILSISADDIQRNSIKATELANEMSNAFRNYEMINLPEKDKSFLFTFPLNYYSIIKNVKEMEDSKFREEMKALNNNLKRLEKGIRALEQQKSYVEYDSDFDVIEARLSELTMEYSKLISNIQIGGSLGNHAMAVVVKNRDVLFYDPNGRTFYTPVFLDHINRVFNLFVRNHATKYPDSKIREYFANTSPDLFSGIAVNGIGNITGDLDKGICGALSTYLSWLFIVNPNARIEELMAVYNKNVGELNQTVKNNSQMREGIEKGVCFTPQQCAQMYNAHVIKFFKFSVWSLNYSSEFTVSSIPKPIYDTNYPSLAMRVKERNRKLGL